MRALCCAAVTVFLLATVPSVLGQEEMLKNPTLEPAEDAKTPEGWRFGSFKTNGEALYEADAGQERDGAAGIRCPTEKDRGCWVQTMPLEGRKWLMVSGRYRTEGIKRSGEGATVRITWLAAPDKWDFISDTRVQLTPSEAWREFEEVVVAPEGALGVAAEMFNFWRTGTVWWDELHLREAAPEEVRKMAGRKLDREPQDREVQYEPADGEVTAVSPPPFVWLPSKGIERYVVQFAPDADFEGAEAVTVEDWEMTVYTPHEPLKPGKWAWRYGFDTEVGSVFSRARSFEIPEDAQAFPLPHIEQVMARIPDTHPRVYFRKDELEALRDKVKNDEEYAKLAAPVIRSAEKKLGEELYPEPQYLPKGGQERSKAYLESFRTMRPFTGGMAVCAKAYILTGDERFGQEARRRLLHFMSWDPEGPTSVRNNDEAAMDLGMRGPRTYDWIYDTLTDEERELCRKVLGRRVEQMHELHRRMPFDSRPHSSHPGRMIGFVVEDSIIFAHEIPEAKDWLEYTLRLMWSVYPVWGNPDGGWAEGPGYWSAYIGMLLPVVMELDRLGVPYKDLPFLQNTGWFGLYAVPVGGKMRPFGDGHESTTSRSFGYLLYRLSTLYRNGYWRWYAEQLGAGPGTGVGQFYAYDASLEAKAPSDIPQARCFPYIGEVAIHSDLARPSEDVYLLMRSSPYGSYSHSHASQNAIAIGAFEEALAISSGYYQRYGSPHHAGWTWETKAHNSVLVDGEGQVKRSLTSRGKIAALDDQDDYCYAVGDAAEAYGGRLKRFLRRVLFIRPNCFVICDELASAGESSYQWLLHAKSKMALDEAAQAVTITQGEARLRAELLAPRGLKLSQMEGFPIAPEREDSPDQYHFTADTVSKSAETTFISVLSVYRDGEERSAAQAALVEGEGGSGVRLSWDEGSALVAWRLGEAERVKVGDLETEAEVAVVRRDAQGKVTSVYAYGAETVMVGGQRQLTTARGGE